MSTTWSDVPCAVCLEWNGGSSLCFSKVNRLDPRGVSLKRTKDPRGVFFKRTDDLLGACSKRKRMFAVWNWESMTIMPPIRFSIIGTPFDALFCTSERSIQWWNNSQWRRKACFFLLPFPASSNENTKLIFEGDRNSCKKENKRRSCFPLNLTTRSIRSGQSGAYCHGVDWKQAPLLNSN